MKIKRSIAISDSGFVFDASTGDSYTLNAVGQELLNLIRNGLSDEEIGKYILAKYDVDQATFERYFYDFVFTLKQMQILHDYE